VYAWLWRKLPGPTPVRVLEALLLALVVVALLFTVVFPWLEPRLPFNDVTVDETPAATAPATPGPSVPATPSLAPHAPGTPSPSAS
jgi:hypothetical protein